MSARLWVAGVAAGFWSWAAGVPWLAIPLLAAVAGPTLVMGRLRLTETEYRRAADLCWLLALGGLLLIYSRENVGNILRTFAQWLPLLALPMVLAQVWSGAGKVSANCLLPFPAWRRRPIRLEDRIDLLPTFTVVCLLSASAAGAGRSWFYPGAVAVAGGMLWVRRGRAAPVLGVVTLLVLGASGGWYVSRALGNFQEWIENGVLMWTSQWHRDGAVNRISRTAIGRSGRVGGSTRVVLRLWDEGPRPVPRLLRVAGYSVWRDGTWHALRSPMERVDGFGDEWVLDPEPARAGAVRMEWARGVTEGFLPLPSGTRVLRDLPAERVDRNPFGAVRADVRGGVVALRAEYAGSAAWEAPPIPEDSAELPAAEREAVLAVVEELGLWGLSAGDAVARIGRFFQTRFRYSTDLRDAPSADSRAGTPLGRFLLGHRTGHCEYFATAAVLMLRAAGVPARYSAGYLLDPAERVEGAFTVRESHGHAWVRVWANDAWMDFDPTPSDELGESGSPGGTWRRLMRVVQTARFTVARWWWLGEKQLLRQAYWLVVPLLAALLWRLRGLRLQARARTARGDAAGPGGWPGLDSEWFAVDERLAERGWARRFRESIESWSARLAKEGWAVSEVGSLVTAYRLHCRLRFDPLGLRGPERARLRESAGRLVQRLVPGAATRA